MLLQSKSKAFLKLQIYACKIKFIDKYYIYFTIQLIVDSITI